MAKNATGPKPRELTEDELKEVEKYAKYGFTVKEICIILKISRRTFGRMQNRDVDLAHLVVLGRSNKIVALGENLTNIGSGTCKGNPAASIFLMKALGHGEDRAGVIAAENEEIAREQDISDEAAGFEKDLDGVDPGQLAELASVLSSIARKSKKRPSGA